MCGALNAMSTNERWHKQCVAAAVVFLVVVVVTLALVFHFTRYTFALSLGSRVVRSRSPGSLFLLGLLAGVIGVVLLTACEIGRSALADSMSVAVFAVSLLVLFHVKTRIKAPVLIGVVALAGVVLFRT